MRPSDRTKQLIMSARVVRTKTAALALVDELYPPLPTSWLKLEEYTKTIASYWHLQESLRDLLCQLFDRRNLFRIYKKPAFHFCHEVIVRVTEQIVDIRMMQQGMYEMRREQEKRQAADTHEGGTGI